MTEARRRRAPLRAEITDGASSPNGSTNGTHAGAAQAVIDPPPPPVPPGPGYWMASDGNWYPPQAAPAAPAVASQLSMPLRNGSATGALVFGIVGALVGLIPLFFAGAFLFGTLAVVFGLLGRSRAKKLPVPVSRGRATAGTVLGLAALGLGVMGVVIVDEAVDDLGEELDTASEWSGEGTAENPAVDDVVLTECVQDEFGGVKAKGTITNHSSERSNYMFSINVVDEAGTKIGEGGGMENNIDAGQDAVWETMAFLPTDFAGAFSCSIVDVTRLSAE